MSSAVAELDGILQSMLNLKPPGVSGSKVTAVTSLCTANVQSESVLIQKIFTHFKKAPGTHKLGVLYVVDSVTRQWVDQAKKAGQKIGSGASDGTFAAGVTRITELLPVLMNDIISSAPEDQKVRVKKLVDIWDKANTFPSNMLAAAKQKLDAPPPVSTTPIGSPSPGAAALLQGQTANTNVADQPNTAAILAALANMPKAAPVATTTAPNPLPVDSSAGNAPAVNPLGAFFGGMNNAGQNQSQPTQQPNGASNPLAAMFTQAGSPASVMPQVPAMGPDMQQSVQLIQMLAAQGVPPEQWGVALQLLNAQNAAASGPTPGFPPPPIPANSWPNQNDQNSSRDQNEFGLRSPNANNRRRSRSPTRDSPPRRRNSPVYDTYQKGQNDHGQNGQGRYRQRSPQRRDRSPESVNQQGLPPPPQKRVEWDHSMGSNMIRVLSRTLFVGGVTSTESHLRGLFSQYGVVQTCIVNVDKRHAFVKMINRKDALSARDGMEQYKTGEMQLRTRWGVGFGPRDCSDYQSGVSVIPIDRLTDADRKWLVSAEYGGTGGEQITGGMVVEEPDIEIGAGVSSKAISRRMATDQGGRRGPQSTGQNSHRGGGGNTSSNRNGNNYDNPNHSSYGNNQNSSYGSNNSTQNQQSQNPNMMGLGVPPPVPGFGFNFPMMSNGMPMLPPGFTFPGMPGMPGQGGEQDK